MSPASQTRRPYRRFMRWFWILLGGYFMVTTLLSLTVNPWRINRTPLSLDVLDESRDISSCIRVGKAALANQGDWQVLLLGSSRVEQMFDPAHKLFEGKRTVNLAMAAAGVLENVAAGHYALDRNPETDLLFLGIDAGDLHSSEDSRTFTRFYESPFADNNLSIERGVNQLIGGRSLMDSVETIQRHLDGKRPDRTPLGQCIAPDHPANIIQYVENAIRRGFENPGRAWQLEAGQLNQEKVDELTRFLGRARREGVEVHVFVPVQHALKMIHPDQDLPAAMCWERDLAELARICEEVNRIETPGPAVKCWSFLTFNDFNTRALPEASDGVARMDGWYDLGHAKSIHGECLLETMLARTDQPVGIELSTANWAQICNKWTNDHREYCLARADDVQWLRSLSRESAGDGKE